MSFQTHTAKEDCFKLGGKTLAQNPSVSAAALRALLFTGKHVARQQQLQEASPENLWVPNKGAVGRN